MGKIKRFLADQDRRERRHEVRVWLQRHLGRAVSDDEIDDGVMDDFEIDEAIRAGRLGDLLKEEADDEHEEDKLKQLCRMKISEASSFALPRDIELAAEDAPRV